MHTAIRKRFELFEESSFRILVGLWRADVAAASVRPGGKVLNTAASVKLASRLIEDGFLAKAMPYLEESGLGNLDLPEIRTQHPQGDKREQRGSLHPFGCTPSGHLDDVNEKRE